VSQGEIQYPAIQSLEWRWRLGIFCRLNKVGCQQRRQHPRDQQGEQYGDGDGKTELLEELSGEPLIKATEKTPLRQCRGQYGEPDLVGAFHCSGRISLASTRFDIYFKMASTRMLITSAARGVIMLS
jgi:hypothetical protein